MSEGFEVKDSGKREEYDNGFIRDTEDGKPDYARIMAIPGLHLIPIEMLERMGSHMLKGAEKYGMDNWRRATGLVAKLRFSRSLFRHARALILGKRDEDHAAAVWFNVAAYELTPAEDGYFQDDEGAWWTLPLYKGDKPEKLEGPRWKPAPRESFVGQNIPLRADRRNTIEENEKQVEAWLLCPGIDKHQGRPCRIHGTIE